MQCFIDHIGIKSCGSDTPQISITQLPGITFKMIDSIVNDDYKTFVEMYQELQQRAMRKFQRDYERKFKAKYLGFCEAEEGCTLSDIACDNIEIFTEPWMYCIGIELMIERLYTTRMNRFTTIDKQQAEELKDYYTAEYEKTLNQSLCMIPKETIQQCCLQKQPGLRYREQLP